MFSAKRELLSVFFISAILFSVLPSAADQTSQNDESDTITGTLEVYAIDDFESGVSQRGYAIRVKQPDSSDRIVPIAFASIQPDSTLKSGDTVTISGQWLNDMFAVHDLQRSDADASGKIKRMAAGITRNAQLTGNRKAVVLVVNMINAKHNHEASVIKDYIAELMYTGPQNVKGLYEYSSFYQLSFDPDADEVGGADVFGFFDSEYSSSADCRINSGKVFKTISEWADNVDKKAEDEGYDLTQYDHRIYFLPNAVNCKWKGMASEGCSSASPCRVWVIKDPSDNFDEGKYIAHELGHNLYWRHATEDADNDGQMDDGKEYGDESGIMGWPEVWAQANAPHRDQLQWFDTFPDALVNAECSGKFELHALELDAGDSAVGPQVVKLAKPDTNEFYYLSYRREVGPYPSNPEYADKINIHRYDGNWSFTYHITNLDQNDRFQDTENGITVTATSAGGETARVSVNIANEAPSANFSYTILDGHLAVRFNNTSSDEDGNIESYRWRINGETITRENPEYTFPDGGTYAVTLTAIDVCGKSHQRTRDIKVVANNPPTADFTYSADHLNVQFTDVSEDSDGSIASRQWDFGDGSSPVTDTNSPDHIYAQSGTYIVRLTVTDGDGATDDTTQTIEVVANNPPDANFNAAAEGLVVQFTNTSLDSDGTIASHLWKFTDDSSQSDLAGPGHTYAAPGTYKVQLTVTDDDGATDTVIKDITVNLDNVPPTADFTLRAERLSVAFTDASTDNEGSITGHRWNFGDGGTSSEASPSHTYAASGSYTVSLTVTDQDGQSHTVTKDITVDENNVPPTAAFTFVVDTDTLDVQFSDTSSDSDGAIATYLWDFGDGATSEENSPQHTYPGTGTYTVELTVTDNNGAIHTKTEDISIDRTGIAAVTDNPSGGGGGGGCFVGGLF
jgi:PKD repeat protein